LAAAGFAEAFFRGFLAGAAASEALARRVAVAFFTGRAVARALLAGVRLPAFAVDRFFAAMSTLIIRYRDR
jgi:hypothetical protein